MYIYLVTQGSSRFEKQLRKTSDGKGRYVNTLLRGENLIILIIFSAIFLILISQKVYFDPSNSQNTLVFL